MKKITLFVIILWMAIGMSVAAITIPAISSDAGKTPAIPQDTVQSNTDSNAVNDSISTKEKNNNSGQLKKDNSLKSNNKEKDKTKDNSKN